MTTDMTTQNRIRVNHAPAAEVRARIEGKLRAFEDSYGCPSAELASKFNGDCTDPSWIEWSELYDTWLAMNGDPRTT